MLDCKWAVRLSACLGCTTRCKVKLYLFTATECVPALLCAAATRRPVTVACHSTNTIPLLLPQFHTSPSSITLTSMLILMCACDCAADDDQHSAPLPSMRSGLSNTMPSFHSPMHSPCHSPRLNRGAGSGNGRPGTPVVSSFSPGHMMDSFSSSRGNSFTGTNKSFSRTSAGGVNIATFGSEGGAAPSGGSFSRQRAGR